MSASAASVPVGASLSSSASSHPTHVPPEGGFSFEVGKSVGDFRVYDEADTPENLVFQHYKSMRSKQCVAFVERMERKWLSFDKAKMTVREAFDALGCYEDSSDPDAGDSPNTLHALQTAEGARAAGAPDWLVLVALVHDLGKAMCVLGGLREDGQNSDSRTPQYALGGDTWVVGCRIPDCAVLPSLSALNPDRDHPVYGTEMGPYAEGCGIMNLRYAFGHDEYMYRFALHNKIPFPPEGLAMLRLHSCYPLHTGNAYKRFEAEGDEDLKRAVRRFNAFDLYTKSSAVPVAEEVWPYYQGLIDKYMPGKLEW